MAPYGRDDESDDESDEHTDDRFRHLPDSFHTLDVSDETDPDAAPHPGPNFDRDDDPDGDTEIEVDMDGESGSTAGETDLTFDDALEIFETVAAVAESLDSTVPSKELSGPDASDVTLIEPGPNPESYHAGDAFISDSSVFEDPPVAILDSVNFEDALVERLDVSNPHYDQDQEQDQQQDQQQRPHEMPGDIDPDTDDSDWQIVIADDGDVLYSGHIGQWTQFEHVDAGELYQIHEIEIDTSAEVEVDLAADLSS